MKKTKSLMMNRQQALTVLTRVKPELVKRFGVTRLALFGSTVRNEAKPGSDIDIVVSFDGVATSEKYFGVQFYLEDELDAPIDLVTEKAIRPELRPFIEREAVNV
ncbi:MAG: nucleotidyltransferase family protein [Methylobacter sp.]|uniref:nucleotidyltransferase family protein n=1 Tax=Methylobacter sp. TaxID=2051955 RepID=UPI00272F8732|nr:nucleotidyltransferase family protein [Methylobacter sp.]MDP1667307.1 nucleotidyltransferase family protein [Methylobacter sp.]